MCSLSAQKSYQLQGFGPYCKLRTIIISYPTSASGITVLLKTPTKYREFFPTLFVKTTDFQLVFNFEQARTVTIFGEHGVMVVYHNGQANQSSRIALPNDSVFNKQRILHGSAEIQNFSSSVEKFFTSERSERLKDFLNTTREISYL